ncbi:hypothetical protein MHZ92_17365 [Sporosarcina sp. ACRSL]|uniref:hypothetical protein n=1 Tax=Sporosarcina sp. ACRSL TaxID=2918215 RepID=UPI001EF6E98C|nr:hypothetical protein [Sporosarcina sp. ACRSL]MCG7345884.1 hypothetical protein [Sporosarcina sp. ACRSL]
MKVRKRQKKKNMLIGIMGIIAAFVLVVTLLLPLSRTSGVEAKKKVNSEIESSAASELETRMSPEIEVPYDLDVVENTQKSVDAGHSPWNLDPGFVAQVFASLQLSPEGIVGEYPIAYEELKVLQQTTSDAIVEVNSDKSAIAAIYLKRLVRQDDTGIWTVVGYDLKNNVRKPLHSRLTEAVFSGLYEDLIASFLQ